ncbi:MAG: dihydroneopterin aldolase [Bacteroidales bacterium]|nr:dihydroneopterin aldolase [Bacteroidales bacterium]
MRFSDFGKIELLGMEFLAYHGCLESEKELGGDFVVDFKAWLDLDEASRSDRLDDTLDYSRVYSLIAGEMSQRSDLLEHVAGRICRALEAEFPDLPAFEVRVCKKNPPVGGSAFAACVTLKGGCRK